MTRRSVNVTNSFDMNDLVTTQNSITFGQVLWAKDPRIMQFAAYNASLLLSTVCSKPHLNQYCAPERPVGIA